MRRFERRAKHAPMDFSYDSNDRTRADSPFSFGQTRQDSQSGSSTGFGFGGSAASPSKPAGSSSSTANGWSFGTNGQGGISPFAFTSPPQAWTPPHFPSGTPSFHPGVRQPSPSPAPMFAPLAPEADMADISMSTAGSDTPDASPTLARAAARRGRDEQSDTVDSASTLPATSSSRALALRATSESPLRRSTFKQRDRDRSRERERAREKRRGLSRPRWDDGDDSGDEQNHGQVVADQYHFHIPEAKLTHGDLPYVLSGYVQFFFNLSLLLLFIYGVLLVLATIRRDVNEKVAEYSANSLREIAQCTNTYLTNRCNPETRIPLMETTCRQLEECMNQDPGSIGRAKVAAETFAQVVNSFVEEISWKTLAFTLSSLSFLIVFINMLLTLYRSKHTPPPGGAPSTSHPPSIAPAPVHFLGGPQVTWGSQQPWREGSPFGLPIPIPETPRRRKAVNGGKGTSFS